MGGIIMKQFLLFLFTFFVITGTLVQAQTSWTYQQEMDIQMAEADSLAVPFLCATDNQGNLWMISSSTSSPGAMNALFMAHPGDTVFTLIDDYANDLDVETPRGITTIDDTVFVVARKPDKATAIMLEYPNGDPGSRVSYTTGGYGTWVMGLSANKDKYIYAGISYLTSIRVYDFRDNSASRSTWVPIDPLSSHPHEPGGHDGASLISKIRDVAVIPGADYTNPETPWYSSREADTLGQYGGLAVWTGGTQTTPIDYSGLRITDTASDLAWLWWTPYGLTCDRAGNLYACGTDTTRRWVKSYSVFGNFAVENFEMPSANSTSYPAAEGAPMESPTDIALSPDEKWAYVTDMDARRAFVFHDGPLSIDQNHESPVSDYQLFANYPNPFNPETVIPFRTPVAGLVELSVYNIAGEKVANVINKVLSAGYHEVRFSTQELSSGIYFYVLRSRNFSAIRKMTLIK